MIRVRTPASQLLHFLMQTLTVQALDTFNTAVVSPIYYVMFTSLTILASAIMFKVHCHNSHNFYVEVKTHVCTLNWIFDVFGQYAWCAVISVEVLSSYILKRAGFF